MAWAHVALAGREGAGCIDTNRRLEPVIHVSCAVAVCNVLLRQNGLVHIAHGQARWPVAVCTCVSIMCGWRLLGSLFVGSSLCMPRAQLFWRDAVQQRAVDVDSMRTVGSCQLTFGPCQLTFGLAQHPFLVLPPPAHTSLSPWRFLTLPARAPELHNCKSCCTWRRCVHTATQGFHQMQLVVGSACSAQHALGGQDMGGHPDRIGYQTSQNQEPLAAHTPHALAAL